MKLAEPSFRSTLDVEGFEPRPQELETIQAEIERLKPLVEEFPTQILHVNIEFNSHSEEYEVKLALILPGQTFATGNVTDHWEPGLETSVQNMIRRVTHYKATMSGEPERARIAAGTTMEVEPNRRMDGQQVANAVEQDNFVEFRKAMYPIEETLRDRIGRWIQRYPQIQANLGQHFTLADVVEETFMMAFDNYHDWQPVMFFGQWIETLIDPAMKKIARDPDSDLETISFQNTWNEIKNLSET